MDDLSSVATENQAVEPSTSSTVKEERILARRKRVQAKIKADRLAALGEEPQEEVENVVDPEKERVSSIQILTSNVRLEKLSTDGMQLVTNIAVAEDSKEMTRRLEEEEAKRVRSDKLEAEATAGTERFEEISKKWLKTKSMKIPQDLQSLLQEQKATCSAMIDEKDKLIHELQEELKAKDDQYVKHLKKQAEDVDLILERMEDQTRTVMKAYREELDTIEASFATERKKLLDSQQAEWDKAVSERGSKEKYFLESKEKRIEDYERQIKHLRMINDEEINKVKITLETDIQILQQQNQQMRATFQLNSEKLEYNFQVLKKRDEENTVTISQQKRRITRLQDTLNNLRSKLSKQEKSCQVELQALMEEYRKNTEQYRELQKKVKHFQLTDRRRFHDIWLMNEEQVRGLAKEVESADRVIHEQQLGLKWEPLPDIESPISAHSTKLGREVSGATLYASQILSETEVEQELVMEGIPPPDVGAGARHTPRVIKMILELLCAESDFLIESKLARLLAPLEKDEQMLMRLDSVFNALGIETEEDIHQLANFFIQPSGDELGTAPSLIHPNEVPAALRLFVEQCQGAEKASTMLSAAGSLVGHNRDYAELLSGEFWEKMAHRLPENHERVWSALLEGLESYYGALQARSSLIGETDTLRLQNGELRMLLHQYMSARVNQELEIPPTLTMPV